MFLVLKRTHNIYLKNKDLQQMKKYFYSPALKWGGGGGGGRARLDLDCTSFSHNFVSTQYLENKLIECHQILYMHSY